MYEYSTPEKQIGKISAASFLRDKEGIKPGLLSQLYNSLGIYNAGERQAKDRMKNILDMVYATKTGKELMESVKEERISIAFYPELGKKYVHIPDNAVALSPDETDDNLANDVIYQLHHIRQEIAIEDAFGDREYFSDTAEAFVDDVYPKLIAEANAYVGQMINAYEMHLQGIFGPWLTKTFSYQSRAVAKALQSQLDRGEDLYSDATRQALFTAWMTKSQQRAEYDRKYLSHLSFVPNYAIDPHLSGMLQKNEDLVRIADVNGRSPLKGLDLTQASFLGPFSDLTITKAVGQLGPKNREYEFAKAITFVSEFIELAEDHYGEFDSWKDLTGAYAQERILSDEGFRRFDETLKKFEGHEDDPRVENLLSYIANLEESYPEFAQRLKGAQPVNNSPQLALA